MKHGIAVKFLAVLLSAFSLACAVGGAAGIIAMESAGLYVNGLDKLQDQELNSTAREIAQSYTDRYIADTNSNLPYEEKEQLYPNPEDRGDADYWQVQIRQGEKVLTSPVNTEGFTLVKTFKRKAVYPVVSLLAPGELPDEASTDESKPDPFMVVPPETYRNYREKTVRDGLKVTTYYYYYCETPEYEVTVYMHPEILQSSAVYILTDMYPYRYGFIAILALGLMLFAAGIVYLVWSAGKAADNRAEPGGLNRLPLDLYLLGAAGVIYALWFLFDALLERIQREGPHLGNLSLVGTVLILMILPVIGVIMAVAAQVKQDGYWWRSSILRKTVKWINAVSRVLPVMWQYLLIGVLMGTALVLSVALGGWHALIPVAVVCLLILCYGGYAQGTLVRGTQRMVKGDLNTKINTRYLIGIYARSAEHMNALADAAMDAAQKQMRSERMRTELITNVSHDIKTPLTSIINYVDLLERPHNAEEQQQYLSVLGRQSQRMKKLIEDLVEMSKMSSGNLTVDRMCMDASEAVNQALGEFSDKLEKAQLQAVFRQPAESIRILADGRLTWRVLSNLLSNVVKYAMPGTRVYVDVEATEQGVEISVKNISKDPLTVSAEELTERFVRGDASRNTEGSGLGLHIAKGLMELQKGQLILQTDGDMFKAVLVFEAADCS